MGIVGPKPVINPKAPKKVVYLRMTGQEHAEVHARARIQDLSAVEFIRSKIFAGDGVQIEATGAAAICQRLEKIHSDLEAITRYRMSNSTEIVFRELKDAMADVRELEAFCRAHTAEESAE